MSKVEIKTIILAVLLEVLALVVLSLTQISDSGEVRACFFIGSVLLTLAAFGLLVRDLNS
jgi:hypothetical protein